MNDMTPTTPVPKPVPVPITEDDNALLLGDDETEGEVDDGFEE